MRTEEIKIYTYSELSDEAKERARDWYRSCDDGSELQNTYDDLQRDLKNGSITDYTALEHLKGILISGEIEQLAFNYRGCSEIKIQGDEQKILVLAAEKLTKHKNHILRLIKAKRVHVDYGLELKLDYPCNHVNDYSELELSVAQLEKLFIEQIKEIKDELIHFLEKHMQDSEEFYSSDECIEENIIANEYEFTENGDHY